MRYPFNRFLPVFNAADAGGGTGDGGAGNGGTGDGGGNGGWAPPQGLPAEFAGSSADEALSKLIGGYSDLNTRFGGLREKLSKMPAAPEKPDMYTFEPGDNLKPFFGDFAQNPAFSSAREAAHKHGLSQEQFAGFISDVYSPLVEQGVLEAPFDPVKEIKGFQTATGLDTKGAQEALIAAETFAKGLTGQLKDVPEALKADVEAHLMSLTDTAAGNVLLRALAGRLGENGIRISGDPGGQGQLTAADLAKLDADPRIDPRNRDHKDPGQRFDPDLRKRYDDAYARLHSGR
ncbi:hypothetical protein [Sinorhizobium fredii]|uniref:hypothetical protein n=1 Tax=Rhizobium fredii TaxID=380 RepID=UPI0004B21AC6|nr:hypothetical protein [Sinorhizobium fredii]ASY69381.1 hypothetical protein SF83666_c19650 [Sinorhizobium fredii CCBAU 83666]